MSSGFVSGGTTESPTVRSDEWLAAQQEIEASRRRKADEASRQQDGKTLYEVLQGNKAAKQEAFEEAAKLKNQFRNLDEDEVEFLDSVLESTRRREAEVKKETREGLEAFRKQQEEADKALKEQEADVGGEAGSPTTAEVKATGSEWKIKKRKRGIEKEGTLKGLKRRQSEPTKEEGGVERERKVSGDGKTRQGSGVEVKIKEEQKSEILPLSEKDAVSGVKEESPKKETAASTTPKPVVGLGLAGYSSDEDD